MPNVIQTDFQGERSEDRLFALDAYFFAFFPWAVMNNIDFISEEWRTVRRTYRNARIYLASSITLCLYAAVIAEAQRRTNDNKELEAALVALMLDFVQLMRTLMGILQIDVFVSWSKHARECYYALISENGEKHRGEPRTT